MTDDETAHIARTAAALDDPHAALGQHLHGDAEVIADAPLVAPDVKPRSLVAQVEIGDGAVMSIPDPRAFEDGGLEWCLRYTCPDLPNNVQFQAASVVESYDYLLGPDITMKEAIDRLRIMRRARAALNENRHD